jgi:hypothetical protein
MSQILQLIEQEFQETETELCANEERPGMRIRGG